MSYPVDQFYIGKGVSERDPSRLSEVKVLKEIFAERNRQTDRWGDQSQHDDKLWFAILAEEFGEVAKALLQSEYGLGLADFDVYEELVQTATVCLAWLEALNKRWKGTEE